MWVWGAEAMGCPYRVSQGTKGPEGGGSTGKSGMYFLTMLPSLSVPTSCPLLTLPH